MMPPSILGHLSFQFRTPDKAPFPAGTHPLNLSLGIEGERDTILVVPEGLDTDKPVKLLVMFHGAGGSAEKSCPFSETGPKKKNFS